MIDTSDDAGRDAEAMRVWVDESFSDAGGSSTNSASRYHFRRRV